jgi:hypothetical protein
MTVWKKMCPFAPGRYDHQILVGRLDKDGRADVLRIYRAMIDSEEAVDPG